MRGSVHGRTHSWYDPDSESEFWNYSFEEFGKYDIRACVEFISNKKPNSKMHLIPYSLGTSSSFFAISDDPEYFESKIDAVIALAPVAYLKKSGEDVLRKLSK